ncbi:hypothetical protein NDU88_006319 [Pleurodeles waltl]|uniref:Uncharacterized protein n=1 Tax=Pleurodeles waltl TaxID=8319 RepID=A0AAV7N2N8_PLEWA|nr:hypothetical protein NDU88_006319 [Pleurodeles waltl]
MMRARQDASREREYLSKMGFFYLENAVLCCILQPTVEPEGVLQVAQIRNERKTFSTAQQRGTLTRALGISQQQVSGAATPKRHRITFGETKFRKNEESGEKCKFGQQLSLD